jgi:hypothetical protein
MSDACRKFQQSYEYGEPVDYCYVCGMTVAQHKPAQNKRLRAMLEKAVLQFPNDDGWLHEAKALLWGDSPLADEDSA